MALLIIAVILFIIIDIIIRIIIKNVQQARLKKERALALDKGLNLDFSHEAKSLKRVKVDSPQAHILAVDDEEIVLDSFRKILVLQGYAIDTVQNGKEALGLIQKHHYDFVFTDLKMPEMNGIEVTKAVKHIRPDIDVIIITGYATVESAVECMQYGAMDYVQKPFTEDELLAFVKKSLIKRQDRIENQLKPNVHVCQSSEIEQIDSREFAIPGGAFISENHCWLVLDQEGTVRIGIDDFANKIIGRVDAIELPEPGTHVEAGKKVFSIIQGERTIPFTAPVTGKIVEINSRLEQDPAELEISSYGSHWFCVVDAERLDMELKELKIGQSAVSFFQEELKQCCKDTRKMMDKTDSLCIGCLQLLSDDNWHKIVDKYFTRV
jgi:CheY-like chemotaxis protein